MVELNKQKLNEELDRKKTHIIEKNEATRYFDKEYEKITGRDSDYAETKRIEDNRESNINDLRMDLE